MQRHGVEIFADEDLQFHTVHNISPLIFKRP